MYQLEEISGMYGIFCEETGEHFPISNDRKLVTELLEQVNSFEADPIHLPDIIHDFLYEKFMIV